MGKDISETDVGYLMMFDIKGSTRLSELLGRQKFQDEMASFKDAVDVLYILISVTFIF